MNLENMIFDLEEVIEKLKIFEVQISSGQYDFEEIVALYYTDVQIPLEDMKLRLERMVDEPEDALC